MISWNPWHGCTKLSEGCKNCYVYRLDKMYGRDPSVCKPTGNLDMMIKKDRKGKVCWCRIYLYNRSFDV